MESERLDIKKKVTVVVFPDEDGGYTAVMPYFSCGLIASGTCLTAQGWTVDEALAEARILIEGYLDVAGTEGRYHLEHARLEGLVVRETGGGGVEARRGLCSFTAGWRAAW